MRNHRVPLYCIAIGQCIGVLFEKIFHYEINEKVYEIRERFTPIRRVKTNDFGQPICYGGQTYLFGHDLKALYEMAAIVKREHDEVIHGQLNYLVFVSRKMKDAWQNVTVAANQELELSGLPAVETSSAAQPAVSQDDIDDRSDQHWKPSKQETEGEAGQVRRRIAAFNIYISSSRPPGVKKECGSAAYCAIIQNVASGESKQFTAGFGIRSLSRVDVLALCAVFESGVIPHSTQDIRTVATVHTANEFIASMFSKGILKHLAENAWKTQEGIDAKNKDEWQRVFTHTNHMSVKGTVPGEGNAVMALCVSLAQDAAAAEYTKKFGVSPSPSIVGK
jgi:hypothetical protein